MLPADEFAVTRIFRPPAACATSACSLRPCFVMSRRVHDETPAILLFQAATQLEITSTSSHKAEITQKFLGIRRAKALSVHLANPRATKDRRRRWTGLAVALTVTFTVCDAHQIGLSPAGGFLLPSKSFASLRMMRPEQKATPILASLRISNPALISRKQAPGAPRYFDDSKCFRYALSLPEGWLNPLCPQPKSGESTRGPPRMDPPFFVS